MGKNTPNAGRARPTVQGLTGPMVASAQGPLHACMWAARSLSPVGTGVHGSPVSASLPECPSASVSMCFLHSTGVRACNVPGTGLGGVSGDQSRNKSTSSVNIWGWRETDKIDK